MSATPALAETYVSGSVGLGLLNNSETTVSGLAGGVTLPPTKINDAVKYKTGIPFGVAAGVKSDVYRIEGAVGYQSYSIDEFFGVSLTDSNASILSFMVNGYRDFAIKDSSIAPYVMAGAGIARIKPTDMDAKTGFAWQVGAGLGIKTSEHVTVDLGYRYFRTAKYTVDGYNGQVPDLGTVVLNPMDFDVSGSNFLVGIRYGF